MTPEVASSPADRNASSAHDALATRAPKLAALLGLSRESRVLVVGSIWEGWLPELSAHFAGVASVRSAHELDERLRDEGSFDLVLAWSAPMGEPWTAVVAERLPSFRRALGARGTLVLLAENRLAIRALVAHPRRLAMKGFRSPRARIEGLRDAGFDRVEEFLPLPWRPIGHEFVTVRRGAVTMPDYVSAPEQLLAHTGLLRWAHDGVAYLASAADAGTERLSGEVRRLVHSASGGSTDFGVSQFALRERGALVVRLCASSGPSEVIARITTDGVTDAMVRRNAEWTRRIHADDRFSRETRGAVPEPFGEAPFGTGRVYVERAVEGVLAWTRASARGRERLLLAGARDFIERFDRESATVVRLDTATLDRLLDWRAGPHVEPRVRERVESVERRLRTLLADREHSIVWTHGDYGFGNILVDPHSCELRGVIDWDQAREDLAGVDLLNMLVQRTHAYPGAGVVERFARVAEAVVPAGVRVLDEGSRYEEAFPGMRHLRRELLAWTALRFAQRSMAYSSLYARSRAEVQALLDRARELLA